MTPRRVLICIDSLLPGGAERVAVDLAAALDPERYIPHLLVSRMDGPLRSVAEAADVPITVLGRTRRIDRAAYRAAVAIAGEHDIIHSHKFAGNVLATAIARAAGVPIVVHEHNWGATAGTLRRMIDRRYLAPRVGAYLCCGESVARTVRAAGVPDELITVRPNATTPTNYLGRDDARALLDLPAAAQVVGMLARLRPEKGVDVLVSAMAELPPTAMACVLGDGPEVAQLRAQAARLDLTERIRFAGHQDAAPELLTAFDVVVIPSRWEGLPLAALEAMAAGVPLVASAVGELPDLLADERGWTIPAADADALSQTLQQVLADPVEARSRAAAAQAYVDRHHMIGPVAGELQDIYDAVLAAPAANTAHNTQRRAASMGRLHRDIQPAGTYTAGDPASGYYNDLRGVALEYGSPQEAHGWLALSLRRREHANPVTLLQLGLGAWQLSHDDAIDTDTRQGWSGVAESVGRWVVRDIDDNGRLAYQFSMPHTYPLTAPWASALAQGQALSLLVRVAAEVNGAEVAISRIAATLTDPASDLVHNTDDGPILQEYPTDPPADVLNGWIFALFGLYDVAHAAPAYEPARACREAFEAGCEVLATQLGEYELDSGWTLYDRYPHRMRHVASPFYHALHIELASVLMDLAPAMEIGDHVARWKTAQQHRGSRYAAVGRKVAFRVLKPRGRRAS